MKQIKKSWPLKLIALVALVLVLSLVLRGLSGRDDDADSDDTPDQRVAHAQLEDKPMQPLAVTGWVNGEVTPEQMKGKVVLIDFWATWCGPCLEAIPRNNQLFGRYKDSGLLVVGVCTGGSGEEKMEQVVQSRGIQYPSARDVDMATGKSWRVSYLPTYAVIDRRGVVRGVGVSDTRVEPLIQELLSDKKE